jgi:hypothetical protein
MKLDFLINRHAYRAVETVVMLSTGSTACAKTQLRESPGYVNTVLAHLYYGLLGVLRMTKTAKHGVFGRTYFEVLRSTCSTSTSEHFLSMRAKTRIKL